MKILDIHEILLTYEVDLSARSGLGKKDFFVIGMLNTFYALIEKYASKKKLVDDAIFPKRILCNEAGDIHSLSGSNSSLCSFVFHTTAFIHGLISY